jgi:RNA-binding protein YlmH
VLRIVQEVKIQLGSNIELLEELERMKEETVLSSIRLKAKIVKEHRLSRNKTLRK